MLSISLSSALHAGFVGGWWLVVHAAFVGSVGLVAHAASSSLVLVSTYLNQAFRAKCEICASDRPAAEAAGKASGGSGGAQQQHQHREERKVDPQELSFAPGRSRGGSSDDNSEWYDG